MLNFDSFSRLILAQLLLAQIHSFDDSPTRMYFAIAASPSGQGYSRAFNKTLANITQSYMGTKGILLETLIIELPENGSFSSVLLETLCRLFETKHVVAVLIIGDSSAAFTVSFTAKHAGIPVLWARGHSGFLSGLRSLESSPLEVQLAPTGRELVQALRGLMLQAHWHTFTLLVDPASATALRRPELWATLTAPPLHPSLIVLPSPLRPQTLFRKLADISRSTRGVVVLLSDRSVAVRILDDAKRLNMMDGHFVWMWVNTVANITILNTSPVEKSDKDGDRYKRSLVKSDISDMHVNYLLKNDHFLLFNRNFGVKSSKESKFNQRLSVVMRDGVHSNHLPPGILSLKPLPIRVDRHLVKGAVRLLLATLKLTLQQTPSQDISKGQLTTSCWKPLGEREQNFSNTFARQLKIVSTDALAGRKFSQEIGVDKVDKSLIANFEILNLVPERSSTRDGEFFNKTSDNEIFMEEPSMDSPLKWKRVGLVLGRLVRLDTIIWPGGDLSVAAVSTRARTAFRVVTALAPPFVMESELDEDGQCLRGLPCHRVLTSDKDNLTLVFNEMRRIEDEEEDNDSDFKQFSSDYDDNDRFFPFQKFKYRTNCCYGLAMDLLENIAQELEFDFRLYIVADGFYGSKIVTKKQQKSRRETGRNFLNYRFKDQFKNTNEVKQDEMDDDDDAEVKWNGIVGDLVSGAAHMSFAALSVSSARSEVIDFSAPYFFSGVSFIAAPQQHSEIPLMAFLLPFSPELWIAIFTSLNITAIAVAIYEWLSPFGLNPWGRQRSKNFSMSSALWVMWGLLCGHLVAFKAPKSWPNKFLINVWGGFSVIFVASYTANIAALIAGLFFHNTVSNYHDRSLLSQKVGASRSSAAEYYVQKANQLLWQHMHKYSLENVEEGIDRLRNGSLDILIADTPVLDYYRATDHGCKLQKIGDSINEDTYAIGMTKGFPLKDSISAVIAKYSSNGYMDILQEKWYGGLPCFKLATEIAQPRPLGVAAVTGVFILLGVGMVLGILILIVEHVFFRYSLPILRNKPKGSIWRSRNIMFFSQKLYRFINCVELVSPHHAARELVHTIRQGQITSLFQKSIKRKEHEQRRRRKSKAQFFEMIQEIRSTIRRQQEEREKPLESVTEVDSEYLQSPEEKRSKLSPSILRRTFMRASPKNEISVVKKSPTIYFSKQLFSPRSKKARSSIALNVRRFSTDSVFNSQSLKPDNTGRAIGRRLSKDAGAFLNCSPPDINSRRSSYLDIISSGNKLSGKSPVLSIENISDCSSKSMEAPRKFSDSESIGKKLATLPKYHRDSSEKQRLEPQYSLALGKSVEIISKSGQTDEVTQESNSFDDEIARRSKLTLELQNQFRKRTYQDNNALKNTNNPQIKIQIEDTSKEVKRIRPKTRHQSLGGEVSKSEPIKRSKFGGEQSKSLDDGNKRKTREETAGLPPAPPPPNCSPRNSNGRSPLERLSKDELVLLWRSSESELRSHLLKAIRDKEEPTDPP